MSKYRDSKIKPGKIYYRLGKLETSRHGGDHYRHANVIVGMTTDFSATRDITVRAQSHNDAERFYGLSIEAVLKLDFTGDDNAKLAVKLYRALEAVRSKGELNCDMSALRVALDKMHAVEATYDPRISEVVAVKDVLPASYGSWRDDWNAMGKGGGCTWSAIARDKDEARAIIVLEHKRDQENHYYGYSDRNIYFEQWMEKGQPVIRLDSDLWGAPNIIKWESYFPTINEEIKI